MRWREWAVIFLATVVTVQLFWAVVPGGWTEEGTKEADTDYRSFYAPVAKNFLEGRGWTTPEGDPAVIYPPGFSLALAGVFRAASLTGSSHELWLKVFTVLAMGLAAASLCGLAKTTVGEAGARLSAALWITYPFNLWLTKEPNSEILFLPLFYGALYLFGGILWRGWTRFWIALGAGVLIGGASLVRPIAILVGGLLAGLMVAPHLAQSRRARVLLAGGLLLGNVAIVMPWEVWAWNQTGAWIPLSTGRGLGSIHHGLISAVQAAPYRRELAVPPEVREIMRAAAERGEEGGLRTGRAIVEFLGERARENPLGFLRFLAWKMGRAWYGTDAQRAEEKWALRIQLTYLLMAIGGGCLLWREGGKGRQWVVLAAILVLYFWAMTTMVVSILRYMVPVMGLLFPLVAVLLVKVIKGVKGRLLGRLGAE